jgi:hypothetical protein
MHPKQLEEIERLREQSKQIAAGELLPDVVAFMKREVPNLGDHMFLRTWIPEQGEDVYSFVTSNALCVTVEVPRHGGTYEISEIRSDESLLEFKQGNLSKDRTLNAIRFILSEVHGEE